MDLMALVNVSQFGPKRTGQSKEKQKENQIFAYAQFLTNNILALGLLSTK